MCSSDLYSEWSVEGSTNSKASQAEVAAIYGDFCEDLDTPQAMLKLRALEKHPKLSLAEKVSVIDQVDRLFGLNLTISQTIDDLPLEVIALLKERTEAREAKNFPRSDELRNKLAYLGIEVRDGSEGQTWARKIGRAHV